MTLTSDSTRSRGPEEAMPGTRVFSAVRVQQKRFRHSERRRTRKVRMVYGRCNVVYRWSTAVPPVLGARRSRRIGRGLPVIDISLCASEGANNQKCTPVLSDFTPLEWVPFQCISPRIARSCHAGCPAVSRSSTGKLHDVLQWNFD